MWRIQGEKIWISFGDHDLTPRIGHLLLAKASGPEGEEGISLFLVPDSIHTGINSFVRNSITIRRIEEKLGLHGSPTCALGFEGARGTLIGTPGRGLAQLFVMITNMRLSVGVQGLGVASGAADIALAYAEVRRQGGNAQRPPLRIAEHADIQRLLLGMVARVEVLRGLVLVTAIQADLAVHESDPAAASRARALAQWLLPIVKTTGGEFAFKVASDAIQVLGGAGYTREWPLEQALRDARVFTIYEGTTGMQALDLLHRRLWRDKGSGLEAFLQMARNDAAICPEPAGAALTQCLDLLERAAQRFAGLSDSIREAEAGATAFLKLASLAATAWIAVRLTVIVATDIASSRLRAAGLYWLTDVGERAVLANIQARRGAEDLCHFNDIRLNE
jgi:hypothetical protein